jgi:hypothetical protein
MQVPNYIQMIGRGRMQDFAHVPARRSRLAPKFVHPVSLKLGQRYTDAKLQSEFAG